jgi:hypothetical protein
MRRGIALLALGFGILIPKVGVASECQGKVLFEDNFKRADPAWLFGPEGTVADGKLSIKLEPNKAANSQYQGDVFPDGTQICVTLKLVSAAQPSDPQDPHSAGIIFWAKDYTSYQILLVSDDGKFIVIRHLTSDRQITPIPWQDSAAINKGVGQLNALRILIKGNQAILYINGKEVGKVPGQTPEGGNLVGLWTESSSKSGCTWEFSNFVVSLPSEETP